MSEEHIELRGSNAFELQRLERVLSGLARPALDEDSMAPSTRDALLELGICVGGGASRRDVIERLWGRKRSLIRQMSAFGDWDPTQPVAWSRSISRPKDLAFRGVLQSRAAFSSHDD
jgi:hypothetical protein